MINRVVLVGRLTKEPELKYTQSGIAVTRFTLAVNRPFSNQSGDREADFINCVAWRKQAENTANFLHKGSLAGVDGRIQTSNFEGQDGKRVFMTEVVADSVQFLEPKNSQSTQSSQSSGDNTGSTNQGYNSNSSAGGTQTNSNRNPYENQSSTGYVVSDDDLPF